MTPFQKPLNKSWKMPPMVLAEAVVGRSMINSFQPSSPEDNSVQLSILMRIGLTKYSSSWHPITRSSPLQLCSVKSWYALQAVSKEYGSIIALAWKPDKSVPKFLRAVKDVLNSISSNFARCVSTFCDDITRCIFQEKSLLVRDCHQLCSYWWSPATKRALHRCASLSLSLCVCPRSGDGWRSFYKLGVIQILFQHSSSVQTKAWGLNGALEADVPDKFLVVACLAGTM